MVYLLSVWFEGNPRFFLFSAEGGRDEADVLSLPGRDCSAGVGGVFGPLDLADCWAMSNGFVLSNEPRVTASRDDESDDVEVVDETDEL